MGVDFNEGQIIPVDKPYQWTSTKVVRRVKGITKAKRVGHAGTLDPLATGLLIICTGKATKQIEQIQAQEKEYTGTIMLGATTPTYDKEMEPDQLYPWEHITPEMVKQTATGFLGEQMQVPPKYSAVKVEGQRGYAMSRSGKEFELKAKPVFIKEFEITRIDLPQLDFRIVCSKGTYIRSIAFDFGRKLQSGGYLFALTRTRIGNYLLENAVAVKNLIDLLPESEKTNEAV